MNRNSGPAWMDATKKGKMIGEFGIWSFPSHERCPCRDASEQRYFRRRSRPPSYRGAAAALTTPYVPQRDLVGEKKRVPSKSNAMPNYCYVVAAGRLAKALIARGLTLPIDYFTPIRRVVIRAVRTADCCPLRCLSITDLTPELTGTRQVVDPRLWVPT
jgi:hypothetical protein